MKEGPPLAERLGEILDRDAQFDVASLSLEPEGDPSDGAPGREHVRSYQVDNETLEIQMEKVERRAGLAVWVFSSDTVDLIPRLSQFTSGSPIEKRLPTILVSWTLAGTPIWRWIALLLLAIVVAAISRSLSRVALLLLKPICKRILPKVNFDRIETLIKPVQLLLATVLFRAGIEAFAPPAILRLYLSRALSFLMLFGFAWLLLKIVDLSIIRIRGVLEARKNSFSRGALPLASRLVKAAILIFTITALLGAWGYNTTTILAGLGIGGIAVALAAQKTIENLFGGVAVISDRPVTVGDFCKFGDRVGTVEDIGLRSTRIRTLDRTVVTVPNAEFSAMVLENFTWRDKIWFHPILNLRRDTTPDQVREILQSIRRILSEHPRTETGGLPVRFIGVGSYSLDIEVFAYVLTSSYDEFLAVQQELLLQIMDAVVAAGTALALPTQASIYYSAHAPEEDQGISAPSPVAAVGRAGH